MASKKAAAESLCQIEDELKHRSSSIINEWSESPRNRHHEVIVGSREAVEKIMRDISKKFNFKSPRIGWIAHGPVRMAIYSRSSRVLLLHDFVTTMRICDVVVLALHELVGHFWQEESTKLPVSTSEAEVCAMLCENLSEKVLGTARYALEWYLFRVVRGLVDLRLHVFAGPSSPMQIWEDYALKVPGLRHFVPFKDETLRCAALPAQALTYLLDKKSRRSTSSVRGCNRLCLDA